jgi:chitin disaccharide deacetylase
VTRFLVVNADDFGYSPGVNRGIVECHQRGIVTSTSLMVTAKGTAEAVALSRENPDLSIGLHWDVFGEDERSFDLDDVPAVRKEFRRQLERFHDLLGCPPTHVDSHRHAHREDHLLPVFEELVEPLGVPLRGDGRVKFVGGFYAQWEWGLTELEYVSVPFLQQLLRDEVDEGWTECSCHPGYVTPGFESMYSTEREEEIRTLTDPRVRQTIDELGIRLAGYRDYRCPGGAT